jgi:CubicO group peptidase (beta-lactamase class C family)
MSEAGGEAAARDQGGEAMAGRKAIGFGLAGLGAAAVLVAGVAISPAGPYLAHALPVSAGISAQMACAGVFVSGRDLDTVARRDVRQLSPVTAINSYRLDRKARTVTVSVLGLSPRTAYYRPGVGCTLLVDATPAQLDAQAARLQPVQTAPRPAPWPLGDQVDLSHLPPGVDRAALDKAVSDAFTDDTPDHAIDTRAIVVVYDGQIVAERYAPGFDKTTRLLGWSMSKSVEATLVGILAAQGRLDLDAPAPVSEWRAPTDPRHAITPRQLLRMSSGLTFHEPYDPGTDSTRMLFESPDMGAYAAAKPLAHAPGTVWSYSSGTANILSRMVVQGSGGSLASAYAFAQSHLFGPAGMTSAVFEPDESGVFVGSSYLYATARDWARFGLIYLNGGTINGVRIVPQSFVDFVRTPAPADPVAGYGGQFWLNGRKNGQLQMPHLPADMVSAEGHNDEYVSIFPSRHAVIVRLGWTRVDGGFNRDRHFAAILAALPR